MNKKEYTAWRRFLAWVGLVSLIFLAAGSVTVMVLANNFINANV